LFTVLTKRPRDLAAQYDAHIHCGGRAASLPALVHCVIFPHGYHRPAVCGALWGRPCCGVDERLGSVGFRQRDCSLWAVKLYIRGLGRRDATKRGGALRQTMDLEDYLVLALALSVPICFRPHLVTMLRHAPLLSSQHLSMSRAKIKTEGKSITCQSSHQKDVPHLLLRKRHPVP
jgi:hypothetical protein